MPVVWPKAMLEGTFFSFADQPRSVNNLLIFFLTVFAGLRPKMKFCTSANGETWQDLEKLNSRTRTRTSTLFYFILFFYEHL